MLNTGYDHEGPVAIRYPRGNGTGVTFNEDEEKIEIGKSNTVLQSVEKEIVVIFRQSSGFCD